MKSYTLAQVAQHIGAKLQGDENHVVIGISTLGKAQPNQLSFLSNPHYVKDLDKCQAGAVILSPKFAESCSTNVLMMENPYLGYAVASQLFVSNETFEAGIAPGANISSTASIGEGVSVGPNVTIEEGVQIGANCSIGAGCFIGRNTHIGNNVVLSPNVTLYHDVKLGDRVRVHSGAVIGADGFGFAPHQGGWAKIEQLGGVVINDDVEVGANTTIDRGALDDTVIETGVKLDNQIQIAHNVYIGANTVIAACVGISGSSRIGKHCMIGGGVGIAGHLTVTDKVHLTGMTLVTHDIKEPGVYSSGTAVEPNKSWRKNVARFRQLDGIARRVKTLEKRSGIAKSQSPDSR